MLLKVLPFGAFLAIPMGSNVPEFLSYFVDRTLLVVCTKSHWNFLKGAEVTLILVKCKCKTKFEIFIDFSLHTKHSGQI